MNFTYDAINRLASVVDGTFVTTYTYDAADNVLDVGYPTGAHVTYSYDADDRIVQVQNTYTGSSSPTPSAISSFSYVLDSVGNRLQVTDGTGKVPLSSTTGSTASQARLSRRSRPPTRTMPSATA